MALSNDALQNVLRMVLKGEHYRKAVIDQIADDFFKFTVQYFKDIALAKIEGSEIGSDWYKRYFSDGKFPKRDTAIYAGLNDKTIRNIYGSSAKPLIVEITPGYYDELLGKVDLLVDEAADLEINLNIKYNNVSVELTLSETLVVVNILGVKRSEIRGGAWSSIGKRLELPLMLVLAKLHQVSPDYYIGKGLSSEGRDVDFHFIDPPANRYRCEVKLMGKGNPEGADAVIARQTDIFIADALSPLNKQQLTQRGCHWVELRGAEGYAKIFEILAQIGIPCVQFEGDLDQALDRIIPAAFDEIRQM